MLKKQAAAEGQCQAGYARPPKHALGEVIHASGTDLPGSTWIPQQALRKRSERGASIDKGDI